MTALQKTQLSNLQDSKRAKVSVDRTSPCRLFCVLTAAACCVLLVLSGVLAWVQLLTSTRHSSGAWPSAL
jgi:hypothetical protein